MSALGGLWSFNDVIDVVSLNIKTVYVGSVAPTITYSGQLWSNNVSNILYQRDSTNTIWNPVVGTIEGGTVGNFEIQDLLTVDELTNFKDTGDVIEQISGSGVITNVAAPSGNYVSLFCTVIDPADHVTVLTDPILMVNQAFFVQKDLKGYGFLGTSSDPYKGYGGGAILMGQGFTGLYCPSMFVLTGTVVYPTDPIGSYPSGTYATMIALGSPVADQFYYTTDTKKLYQYISGSWVQQYDNVISGDYDTLFLIKSPSQTPANLYLANLTVRGHIYVKDTNAIMFDDAQDVYLYQNVANGNNILELAGTGMIIDGSLNVNAVSVNTSLGAASANVTGSITVGSNLYFTTNDDVYLYRNTVGSNHILELAGTGMIVDGYVNSSGLSINGNAGITGVLNIAQLTIATQAGSSGDVLTSQGANSVPKWVTPASQNTYAGAMNQYVNTTSNVQFNYVTFGDNTSYPIQFQTGYNSSSQLYISPVDITGSQNEVVGLGSVGHYFLWIDASYGKFNYLTALDGSSITVSTTLAFGSNPFTISSTNVIANLHAANSDALGGTVASSYATQSYVNGQGFITSSSLNSYAQEMNQDVRTTASPTFYNLTLNGQYLYIDTSLYIFAHTPSGLNEFDFTGSVDPVSDNTYGLGGGGNAWAGIVVNNLYAGNSVGRITLQSPLYSINSGGIYLDANWGNMYFNGGSSSNSWNVYDYNGYLIFSILNTGTGVNGTYGSINCSLNPTGNRTLGLGSGSAAWSGLVVGNIYPTNLSSSTGTELVISGTTMYKLSSSLKYKENIRPIENTDWIYEVNPILFDYKEPDTTTSDKLKIKESPSGKNVMGLAAEELYELCPNVVHTENGEPESIITMGVVTAMIAEMKKLRDRITELEKGRNN